eukprot:jgi/Botrbrau1/23288/Bobra.0102s0030.1
MISGYDVASFFFRHEGSRQWSHVATIGCGLRPPAVPKLLRYHRAWEP